MPTLNSARFVNSTNALTDRDQRTQIIQDIIAVNTQVNTNTSNISSLSGNVTTLQGNEVFTTKVTVGRAALLTSFNTPVQLIATPGAGKYIMPLSVQVQMTFNSVAYATNTVTYIGFTDIVDGFYYLTNIDDAATVFKDAAHILEINPGATRNIATASPLMLQTLIGNPTAGNSDYTFYISYKIITI